MSSDTIANVFIKHKSALKMCAPHWYKENSNEELLYIIEFC